MDQYGVHITADRLISCGEERTVRESVAVDSSSAFTVNVFATLSSTVSRSVLMIVIHIYFITSGLL